MSLLDGTPYLFDGDRGQAILNQASKVGERVGLLRSRGHLEESVLLSLRNEWRFNQVYESAAIEGNQLTVNETRMAIQRGVTISGKPPGDSDEVRHLYSALEYLEQLVTKAEPVSAVEIREIHRLVLGDGDPGAGEYRSVSVEISGAIHEPPEPFKVPGEMQVLTDWLAKMSEDAPPLLISAVSHAWIAHIHPFRDGNGRTARAVGNLLLMRAGYPVVVVRHKDRPRYYEALQMADQGDIGPFLELLVDRCDDSLRHMDRIRKAAEGISLADERVRVAEERQYLIWQDAVKLLGTTVEQVAGGLLARSTRVSVSIKRYMDAPSLEDCRALASRDASGAGWLLRLSFSAGADRRSLLLWVGFSSEAMMAGAGLSGPCPSVWVSMENPDMVPQWTEADDEFPGEAREIAFVDGRGFVRGKDGRVSGYDSLNLLATEFVAGVVRGWFGEK